MNVGDKVQWTHVSYRGSTIVLRAWEGPIVDLVGTERAIVTHRGKRYKVLIKDLRPMGQRAELTEMVMGKQQ